MEEIIRPPKECPRRWRDHPTLIFQEYPAILQLLKQKVEKDRDIIVWREYETLIQYDGYTCDLSFLWKHIDRMFYITQITLAKVCKAPGAHEQYDIMR